MGHIPSYMTPRGDDMPMVKPRSFGIALVVGGLVFGMSILGVLLISGPIS